MVQEYSHHSWRCSNGDFPNSSSLTAKKIKVSQYFFCELCGCWLTSTNRSEVKNLCVSCLKELER